MPLKERLVDSHVLKPHHPSGAFDFDDAIDEEKWITVGEDLEDTFDIHEREISAISYQLSEVGSGVRRSGSPGLDKKPGACRTANARIPSEMPAFSG
jgi:hypothetical protein